MGQVLLMESHRLRNTGALSTSSADPQQEFSDILAALERLENKNDYLVKVVEAQAQKLETGSLRTTSATPWLLSSYGSLGQSNLQVKYQYLAPDLSATMEIPAVTKPAPSAQPIGLVPGKDIPLHVVLEMGSILLSVSALASLAMWLLNSPPLLNPFISILALVTSPFFFAMGRIARRNA